MNVTKYFIIFYIFFISLSILGEDYYQYNGEKGYDQDDIVMSEQELSFTVQDQYQHEFDLSVGLHYLKDTIENSNLDLAFWLGYRFYFSSNKNTKILKPSFFIDTLITYWYHTDSQYSFLDEKKHQYQQHFGFGYHHQIKNRYLFSYFGGAKIYYESRDYSFNDKNTLGNYDYKGKSDSFIDYGGYIGVDMGMFFRRDKFSNSFIFKGSIIVDQFIKLEEYRIYLLITLAYML